jgi:hypothetical protein
MARTKPVEERVVTRTEIDQMKSGVVFLDIAMRGTSMKSKADGYEIEELGADAEQAEMLIMHKQLIDQAELKSVRSHRQSLKNWLKTQAVRATTLTNPGMLMIPVKRVGEVENRIKSTQDSISADVEAFLPKYPALKESAKSRLKGLYREDDYPTEDEIRRKFRIDYKWMIFQTPDALSAVSEELYEAERARLDEKWKEAWPEVRDGLREGFAILVSRMAEALQPDKETGEFPKLREPLVEKVHEFLRTFNDRNITSDAELDKFVAQAQGILSDATAKQIRGTSKLRDRMAKDFNAIATNVRKLKTTGARRIVFSD